jgi:hypothetical protein
METLGFAYQITGDARFAGTACCCWMRRLANCP